MTNQVFLISEPEPGDTRERNAFGILKGFGKAFERYYKTQDIREKEMFTYQKSFATSAFHVVYRNKDGTLGTTVAGSNDETMAQQDAANRSEKAKQFDLDCSYVVMSREGGHLA